MGGDCATPELDKLAELVRGAGSVVALTGAGISVPSGIPDFRSPGSGLWEKVDPMEVAHIEAFRADPVRFWRFYGERFATLEGKLPNGAHQALVALEPQGRWEALRADVLGVYSDGNAASDGSLSAPAEYLLTVARLPG